MPKFAILTTNNVVQNVIMCDTLEEAQTIGRAVQCASRQIDVRPGWFYNPDTDTYAAEDTNA
jgi:hypothetical protein